MVTIEEALRIIENQEISLKSESKPLEKALGYALATNTTAPFDVPEFDNSAMDGYALCGLYQEYRLVGEVAAGDSKEVSLQDGEAVRIFTGAKVPQNTTAVMMQEKTSVESGTLFLDDPFTPIKSATVCVHWRVRAHHTRQKWYISIS